MKKDPKVFIIILNHDSKETLKKCLLSVFKNDYLNFEIILVDNNSADGSLEIAKENFSKAYFIKNEENLGFAAGNNIGIRFALERMADYILLLSSGMEVEKDFLTRLVSVAEKNDRAGIFSPLIFNSANRQVQFSGGKISWVRMKYFFRKEIKTLDSWKTDFATDSAMLIKKEVFKKIGLLDEDYFLFWADIDFGFRACEIGLENIVVASSWVYRQKAEEKSEKDRNYWQVVSRLIFFKKNTPAVFKPWIQFCFILERLKASLGNLWNKDEITAIVKKAHKDFRSIKF